MITPSLLEIKARAWKLLLTHPVSAVSQILSTSEAFAQKPGWSLHFFQESEQWFSGSACLVHQLLFLT